MLNTGSHLVYTLVGFGVAWVLIQLILWRSARANSADRESDFHHTSDVPVPRFGGVAVAGVFFLTPVFAWLCFGEKWLLHDEYLVLFCCALAMFGVGFWDDLRPVGAKKKLLLQLVIAHVVYFAGIKIAGFKNPFTGTTYDLGVWGMGLTVFWLVAMTNLINLIDGIDGLAGGISLMLLVLLGCAGFAQSDFPTAVALGVAGSLVAFLRFNFPPARIYLGDGGAYMLGFLIGALSILNSNKGSVVAALIAPLIALGLPIIDTTYAILRRGLRGLPVFRADRKHIHHRLLASGFSRTRTVLILYGVTLFLSLVAFGLFWAQGRWVPISIGLVFLIGLLAFGGTNMIRELFSASHSLGNSTDLRREIRYALTLSACLEQEGERCPSIDKLWSEYTVMAGKLGFSHVKLVLEDGHRVWKAPDQHGGTPQPDHVYEFKSGSRMLLKFQATKERMTPFMLEQLSELAAEAWLKAATRWRDWNQRPLRFSAAEPVVFRPSLQPPLSSDDTAFNQAARSF